MDYTVQAMSVINNSFRIILQPCMFSDFVGIIERRFPPLFDVQVETL